jgi:predicted NUDIX family NTP pyrophosphohydrolase
MSKQSAGILLYRFKSEPEVFLLHPGGPFWAKKDLGAWSIPKGEFEPGEDPVAVAKREFEEETGTPFSGELMELKPVKLKSGKTIHAWAAEGDMDEHAIQCNTFEMEWPPRSGKLQSFPEADRAGWFTASEAKQKLNEAQAAFIDDLLDRLDL